MMNTPEYPHAMFWMTVVTAVATVVNAAAVVALVYITRKYAASSQRQADASEAQAKAATAQATAAGSQAIAAQAQASAASATLSTLREENFNQTVRAKMVVERSIKTAIANIEFWQNPGPKRSLESCVRSKSLPLEIVLVPHDSTEALDAARRISRDLTSDLGHGFDELNTANQKMELLRAVDLQWYKSDDITVSVNEVLAILQHAKATFQRLQTDLYRPQN